MNDAERHLEIIKSHIAVLPPEQRVEVAKLLQQIQAVIKSTSDTTVASATIMLFSAIADASRANAMNQPDTTQPN